ncbi:MAG: transposase [Saprospiraceae bacterium]
MKNTNKKSKRRRYEAKFKDQLLELHANGRSMRSLSESFGINENLLYKWKRLSNGSNNLASKEIKEELEEVKNLRKRLKEVEEERDILKKALSIFSRHP